MRPVTNEDGEARTTKYVPHQLALLISLDHRSFFFSPCALGQAGIAM